MKKSTLFLLIVGTGLLGYLIWPLVVVLFKMAVGIVVIGIIALVWYVARETSKHN